MKTASSEATNYSSNNNHSINALTLRTVLQILSLVAAHGVNDYTNAAAGPNGDDETKSKQDGFTKFE